MYHHCVHRTRGRKQKYNNSQGGKNRARPRARPGPTHARKEEEGFQKVAQESFHACQCPIGRQGFGRGPVPPPGNQSAALRRGGHLRPAVRVQPLIPFHYSSSIVERALALPLCCRIGSSTGAWYEGGELEDEEALPSLRIL